MTQIAACNTHKSWNKWKFLSKLCTEEEIKKNNKITKNLKKNLKKKQAPKHEYFES